MNHIRQAFGEDADLYQVLGLQDRDDAEHPAKLRKAYFRQALVYHPDKTKEKDTEVAKEKFQAISFAYQVLKNSDRRAEYNETGHVADDDDSESDDESGNAKKRDWKEYFDRIFGKVTTSKIDQFALKYKCSEEEQRDVLKEYKRWKGDLVKMLDFVMLSEPLDAKRWVEDYIQPACLDGDESLPDYDEMVQKSLQKLEKKIEKDQKKKTTKSKPNNSKAKSSKKENKKPESDDDEEDEDEEMPAEDGDDSNSETESEVDEEVASKPAAKRNKKGADNNKKVTATKAKPTKTKATKKTKGKEDDLHAMIQANQAKRSGGLFASLGARYGVQMDDDDDEDPIGDDEFDKIQARLDKKKRAR